MAAPLDDDDEDRCEGCEEPFTTEVRPHVTADDVWLCEACWNDLATANGWVRA